VTQPYLALVSRLERNAGVIGVLLVEVEGGLVVAGETGSQSTTESAAALGSSLFRRTRRAAADAGLGNARFVRLEADGGHLCAAGRGDMALVALTARDANLGRLRLEMLRALEQL
jgi:predicted regulator of Ras-like GTPase activity (Roadblock/LC7/MglB family)